MSDGQGETTGRPDPGLAPRTLKKLAVTALRSFERAGIHVLPRHFYSPVADRAWLSANAGLWKRPAPLSGLAWDLDAQLQWLADVCRGHLDEVAGFAFLADLEADGIPFRYGLIEAQVLHGFVRSTCPARIVEVGSGASTALMAAAVRRNESEGRGATSMTAVDPFASDAVVGLGGVHVERVGALEAPMQLFESLAEGDLLFIDSSHAVKTGSELARLYLEVLPGLAPGVVIHIHDIYLPYLYSPWVLEDLWDWQETTLLLALLTGNSHLEVLCSQSALHHARPTDMAAILPDYVPLALDSGTVKVGTQGHFPSSTWLRSR